MKGWPVLVVLVTKYNLLNKLIAEVKNLKIQYCTLMVFDVNSNFELMRLLPVQFFFYKFIGNSTEDYNIVYITWHIRVILVTIIDSYYCIFFVSVY